jgi:16S rRNA (uracil1498-N3)-methyltransferase
MSERFFLSMPPRDGRAVLVGDEARHLARVMRCTVGDEVVVFDGSGTSWRARVASIGRDDVMLDMGEAVTASRLTRVPLTLAVALPKGERQKWLVEKLTELGVERLVPLATTRGVAEATPAAVERLSRGVIEACKQCGRDGLMQIGGPKGVAEVVGDAGSGAVLLVADRRKSPRRAIWSWPSSDPKAASLRRNSRRSRLRGGDGCRSARTCSASRPRRSRWRPGSREDGGWSRSGPAPETPGDDRPGGDEEAGGRLRDGGNASDR